MPRKAAAKKPLSQRTFKLPGSLLAALDAVCEHFDEDQDRVARRLLEDGIRSIASKHSLSKVSEVLGVEVRSPFEVLTSQYHQRSWEQTAPSNYTYVAPPTSVPYDAADVMLPQSAMTPIPRMREVDE